MKTYVYYAPLIDQLVTVKSCSYRCEIDFGHFLTWWTEKALRTTTMVRIGEL